MAYVVIANLQLPVPIALSADDIEVVIEETCKLASANGDTNPSIVLPIAGLEEMEGHSPDMFSHMVELRVPLDEMKAIFGATWDGELEDPEANPAKEPPSPEPSDEK